MASKAAARRNSVPQPGNANPNPGAAAAAALSNNSSTNQAAQAAAASGTLYPGGVSFTPVVSGNLLIMWSTSGDGGAATAAIGFTPTVSHTTSTIPTMEASAGGDAAHVVSASGHFIAEGVPVGAAALINVDWTGVGGATFAPLADGSLVIIELP